MNLINSGQNEKNYISRSGEEEGLSVRSGEQSLIQPSNLSEKWKEITKKKEEQLVKMQIWKYEGEVRKI